MNKLNEPVCKSGETHIPLQSNKINRSYICNNIEHLTQIKNNTNIIIPSINDTSKDNMSIEDGEGIYQSSVQTQNSHRLTTYNVDYKEQLILPLQSLCVNEDDKLITSDNEMNFEDEMHTAMQDWNEYFMTTDDWIINAMNKGELP